MKENFDKNKPVAVITGASRGIGKAITLELSAAGYDIVGISRTLTSEEPGKGLMELKPLVQANNSVFLPLQSDIGDIHKHKKLIDEIIGIFGRIDLLVNNAGISPIERMDLLDMTPESFDEVLRVNLRGPFFFTQAVVHEMIKKIPHIKEYKPVIIFITSISAYISSINRAEYCMSKAGLSMACKNFAHRLADTGIKVFEVRPGIILTDMTASVKEKYDKLIAEGLIPQNRWGTSRDVAKVVKSLVSGDFEYSTGLVMEVSGGMNIRRL
jgi:3-oxoacyl-[acyl-carrier protein] reductase